MSDGPSLETLRVIAQALGILEQSNRVLETTCEGCGRDINIQFDWTAKGFRRVEFYCQCGWLTPGEWVDKDELTDSAVSEIAGEAA
jgi:hypothetical protein